MGSELSGIVACMQQMEIAAARLAKAKGVGGEERVEEIQGTVRGFFLEPSADRARQLDVLLDEIAEECGEGRTILTEPIEVDRIPTTLEALHRELKEVLEDLGG